MALKITPEDFARLTKAINNERVKVFTRSQAKHYADLHSTPGNRYYQRDYLKTLRWDVFTAACSQDQGLMARLYEYLKDDHIDSALKRLLG